VTQELPGRLVSELQAPPSRSHPKLQHLVLAFKVNPWRGLSVQQHTQN
jgi:hypothetical protein